jgi:prepilin peptidase CpaA
MAMAMTLGALALFVWAAADDALRRRIPNWIVGCLAALGAVRLGVEVVQSGPAGPAADLALALAVFAVGAALFSVGAFGGGDVKLMAAGTLWLGVGAFWPFLAWTVRSGGLLALASVVVLAARRRDPLAKRPTLPYGVAIAAGAVAATLSGMTGAIGS